MIRLVYSNRTEELLRAFAERVGAERSPGRALSPVRLVVPNRNVETYVKLGLAAATGIAANLEVTFLRQLLARVAEAAFPGSRVVDARQIQGCLLALLHDEVFLRASDLV